MGFANDIRKAVVGGDYTAEDVAGWLAEQHNAAAKSGDMGKAHIIWQLLKAWTSKANTDNT